MGQVLVYSQHYPDHIPTIVLFTKDPEKFYKKEKGDNYFRMIENHCYRFNVGVVDYSLIDGVRNG